MVPGCYNRPTKILELHNTMSFLKVVGILLIAAASGQLLAAAETLASAEGALAAEKYSVVLATLERLDRREANEPRARFLKGTALAGIGRLDEAAAVLEKLIADQPRMPEAMNNLAMVYARQGRNLEAKKLLERAIRVEERYATIHDNLNAVYEGMARNSYAKALRIEGGAPAPRLELMRALSTEEGVASAQEPKTVAANEKGEDAPAAAKGRAESKGVVVASIEPVAIPRNSSAESRSEEPAPAKGSSLQEQLEQRVTAWAAAWSARDAERYISFYAGDFTAGSGSHSEWAKERRERLTAPEWIKVALADIKVRPLEKGSAEVTFVQRYEAPHFNGTTLKRLRFTLSNGQWLIVDEASVRGKRR